MPAASSKLTKAAKVSRLRQFRVTDGIVSVLLVLLLPLGIGVMVYGLAQIGIMPQTAADLMIGDTPVDSLVQYTLGLISEVGIIAWILHRRGLKLQSIGMRWPTLRWWWTALGLYVVQIVLLIVIMAAIKTLAPAINLDEVQNVKPFGDKNWAIWASFAVSVLVAPVVEEVLFRGILFSSLKTRLPIWLATIAAALIFALLHGQLNAMIYTFVFALLLTWLYARSHSLLPGILLHTLNNAVAFWVLLNG